MNDRSTDDDSEKANKKVRREKILVMGSEQRDTREHLQLRPERKTRWLLLHHGKNCWCGTSQM